MGKVALVHHHESVAGAMDALEQLPLGRPRTTIRLAQCVERSIGERIPALEIGLDHAMGTSRGKAGRALVEGALHVMGEEIALDPDAVGIDVPFLLERLVLPGQRGQGAHRRRHTAVRQTAFEPGEVAVLPVGLGERVTLVVDDPFRRAGRPDATEPAQPGAEPGHPGARQRQQPERQHGSFRHPATSSRSSGSSPAATRASPRRWPHRGSRRT